MGAVAGPAIGAVGSIAGGLLGSRGSSSGGVRVPQWYSRSAESLARFGQNRALGGYVAPPSDRVAPFSADTLAAFDLVRGNVGTTTPYYQNAMGTAERLQNFQAPMIDPSLVSGAQFKSQIGDYLNPYTNQVVNRSLADLETQRQVQEQYNSSNAAAAGAFGNSRHGVMQGVSDAQALQDKGLLAAQLRNQGFESAAGRTMAGMFANQESINRANLANQSAAFGEADVQNRNAFLQNVLAQNMGAQQAADAASLGRIGSAQDARVQQGMDNAYADWFDQYRAYPSFQTGLWAQSLSPGAAMIGPGGIQSGGGLLGALGGAQLGAQAGNAIYDWWRGMSSDGLSPINITAGRI